MTVVHSGLSIRLGMDVPRREQVAAKKKATKKVAKQPAKKVGKKSKK